MTNGRQHCLLVFQMPAGARALQDTLALMGVAQEAREVVDGAAFVVIEWPNYRGSRIFAPATEGQVIGLVAALRADAEAAGAEVEGRHAASAGLMARVEQALRPPAAPVQ